MRNGSRLGKIYFCLEIEALAPHFHAVAKVAGTTSKLLRCETPRSAGALAVPEWPNPVSAYGAMHARRDRS
jgi:hypothetical protein